VAEQRAGVVGEHRAVVAAVARGMFGRGARRARGFTRVQRVAGTELRTLREVGGVSLWRASGTSSETMRTSRPGAPDFS
jgi:hypothetical protein